MLPGVSHAPVICGEHVTVSHIPVLDVVAASWLLATVMIWTQYLAIAVIMVRGFIVEASHEKSKDFNVC